MSTGTKKPKKPKHQLEENAHAVTTLRARPLLVLYYPDKVEVSEVHIKYLNLRMGFDGISRHHPLENLDVLLQTVGGEPVAAYRIAQVIRNLAPDVQFLVPEYAFSAGTLMCLAGDKIILGESAVLSPFDITLVHRGPDAPDDRYLEERPEAEIELVAIDHFIQVAKQARIEIEKGFRERGWKTSKTDVESQMMCEMVKQLGVLPVAHYYREKNIAEAYASQLLRSYMFAEDDHRQLDRILRRLIVDAPSHEFPMDYHVCLDIGLKVEEMDEALGNGCRGITSVLEGAMSDSELFPTYGTTKVPLFQYFAYNVPTNGKEATSTPAVSQESTEPGVSQEVSSNGPASD